MKAEYITPAVTPFTEEGKPDWESLKALYEHLISGGVSGILVLGSIGEFFAVPLEEKREIIRFAAEQIKGRVKFFAGTGSMIPGETAELSRFALEAGADGVVVISPYYFTLTQDSIYDFYADLAEKVSGDIYIYNFPDNTGYTIPPATVLALAKIHPNIVGMKDTVSGMDHTRELIKVVKSQIPQFEIYSGFDDNFAHNVLSGGNGCIGALSNVVPEICSAWVRAFRDNDLAGIARGQQIIDRLMDLYAVRSPFLPVIKEACRLRGIASTSVGTFPMPNATVEDDARILELLSREGVQ